MTRTDTQHELPELIRTWKDSPQGTKRAFLRLKEWFSGKDDLMLSLKARPGVSYSLRAAHALGNRRKLLALVDVIDNDPANRCLNVCFYDDMISDPEERGELIPLGLLGEDGYCFDLEEWDEEYLLYIETRLGEAYDSSLQEAAGSVS